MQDPKLLAGAIGQAMSPQRNPSRCKLHRADRDPPRKVGRIVPDWTAVKASLRAYFGDLATGRRDWPLYLWGETGVGKSCAAVALLNLTANGMYVRTERLCRYVYDDLDMWWEGLRAAELIVVDEVGLRPAGDQRAFLSLQRAADLREHRPTIYISNHPPDKLRELFDDRLHSRLTCGTVVELTGPDRRKASDG